MKAVFDREALLHAFQTVSGVVPSRPVRPVLANGKLVVESDRAVLAATDLDAVGIRYEIRGVQVRQPGVVLAPCHQTASILKEMPDQEITLTGDEQRCVIEGSASEFEVPSEDPAQYPDVPSWQGENYHQIAAGVLRELITRTAFAAAVEGARYALNGVMWELGPERFRLVATDGRRLAVADAVGIMHGKHSTESQTPVVPTKAMTLIERSLTDPEEQVFVAFGPNEVLVKTSRAEVYGRLVEGRFPPYKEVFPKKHTARVKLTAGPFLAAIRQAATISDPESRGVSFAFGKGKVTLSSVASQAGRAKVEMPLEYDGKALQIAFDPRFLTDMLRVLEPDSELTLDLLDENSPALFRVGESYQYIVMPLARSSAGS
ncbi:MAG: DNA polymerase III subunit beta [Gemmatales bacterium]|nr:DNA polymerase III subunit beta [Gemmatales bacterium]MDW8388392.1 DNA polymerase III subunit beta [Gemmatales bacterium]